MKKALNWFLTGLRWAALAFAIMWLGFGFNAWLQFEEGRTLVAHAEVATTTEMTAIQGKTIDQLKDEVIAKLSHDENSDPDKVPFKWDDNKKGTLPAKDKPSYGCMQYKNSTVQRHYKAIHGESISNLEAVLLALDCDKAKALAREAIFGAPNAIEEWTMATPPVVMRVKIIREMSN